MAVKATVAPLAPVRPTRFDRPHPVHVDAAGSANATAFAQWYKTDPTVNLTVVEPFTLTRVAGTTGTYGYASATFFPLDGQGWVS